MDNKEYLRESARTALSEISMLLDKELEELRRLGALTELDKKKLIADATISGRAVIEALEQTDYPAALQRELVYGLIAQFRKSANDVVGDAKKRLVCRDPEQMKSTGKERGDLLQSRAPGDYLADSDHTIVSPFKGGAIGRFRPFNERLQVVICRPTLVEKAAHLLFARREDILGIEHDKGKHWLRVIDEERGPGRSIWQTGKQTEELGPDAYSHRQHSRRISIVLSIVLFGLGLAAYLLLAWYL